MSYAYLLVPPSSTSSANLSRFSQDYESLRRDELKKRIMEPSVDYLVEDFAVDKSTAKLSSERDSKGSMLDQGLKKRCQRKVLRNKYERDAPEIRKWWYEMFKTLEDDAAIPLEEQLPVLQEIFNVTLLNRILKICATRSRKFKEELKQISEDDITKMFKRHRAERLEKEGGSVTTDKKIESNVSLVDGSDLQLAIGEIMSTKKKDIEHVFADKVTPKCKMYTDFFKRKSSRAAVWRTLPPLSMDEMNLNQKADAVTEKIATDFINWLRDLGGDEELSLSVEAVIEMFEIGFHANSATSLKVNLKELPSVPRRVAEAQHQPKKARRSVLRREIMKDVRASKKKTTYTAFGTHLPHDMQVRPPAENYYRKWITCDRVPEKLASMAAVWQGITHLKSTIAFCEFLIERPDIRPPKYLTDCGMMDWKTLKEKEEKLMDDLDNFSEVSDDSL